MDTDTFKMEERDRERETDPWALRFRDSLEIEAEIVFHRLTLHKVILLTSRNTQHGE